jgi:hypothetical protein
MKRSSCSNHEAGPYEAAKTINKVMHVAVDWLSPVGMHATWRMKMPGYMQREVQKQRYTET